ncbi:phage portal protein [Lentisphaerota bacterium WC36G]|nr:phage portal protein [Lentisphaerae bacterium WC36]
MRANSLRFKNNKSRSVNKYEALTPHPQHRQPKVDLKSVDEQLNIKDRKKMIAIAIDAFENTPLIRAIVGRFQDLVVGDGNRLQINIADKENKRAIEDYFNKIWALDHADGRGRIDFFEMQRIAWLEDFLKGDLFAWVNNNENSVYLYDALQCIEPNDWKSANINNNNKCVEGVVVNGRGKILKYIFTGDPNKTAINKKCLHFKAEKIIHLARRDQVRQVRGISKVLTVVRTLNKVNELLDNELKSSAAAAKFAVAIKSKSAEEKADYNLNDITDIDDIIEKNSTESNDAENSDNSSAPIDEPPTYDRLEAVMSGAVEYLAPDEDIAIIENKRPSTSIKDFVSVQIRQVGASEGLPLEILMLDFSSNSFSANRASLMLAWTRIREEQNRFNRKFNRPIALKILQNAANQGIISLPDNWQSKISFSAPGIPSVDRLKDENAKAKALANGTTTLENEVAAGGGANSWQDVMEQRLEEQKKAVEDEVELLKYKAKLLEKNGLRSTENPPNETTVKALNKVTDLFKNILNLK